MLQGSDSFHMELERWKIFVFLNSSTLACGMCFKISWGKILALLFSANLSHLKP